MFQDRSSGRNVSYKAGLMGIAAGVLACAVGVAALREPLESAFQGTESVKSKIQTRLEQFEIPDLRSSRGTGGVNRGELGRIGEFVTDDNTHLKVRVTNKPEERLYLQGYIGTEYTSDRWKNTDTTEFAKWASASGYREKDVKNLPYVMLKEASGKPEEIRIDRREGERPLPVPSVCGSV